MNKIVKINLKLKLIMLWISAGGYVLLQLVRKVSRLSKVDCHFHLRTDKKI